MKEMFASTCLAAAILTIGNSAWAADCGEDTIASMNWQSAEVLASLDKFILTKATDATSRSYRETRSRRSRP
ncbi:L-proline glycine betaine binding ABC transporter protein ProX [Sinorhizobium alkalisoli]|nr:L-proline glycine betaine binding ABC transporter protein ProX [Sinorhizobium alkalisoli]